MATKLEFDVEMSCTSCVTAIQNVLENVPGIKNVEINQQNQQVFVESTLPSVAVQELIESTNRKAILKGMGSVEQGTKNLGSAVAAIIGPNNIFGVIRFTQTDENKCVIDGTIDGLSVGEHGLHIYEFGDLSNGFQNLGGHFNPYGSNHGEPQNKDRHVGDLGNVLANSVGRASFRLNDDAVKVWDVIGRSIGVSSNPDLYEKNLNGSCGSVVAGGIIARSAGLFENPKRICPCSGKTIWDERDVAQKLQYSKI